MAKLLQKTNGNSSLKIIFLGNQRFPKDKDFKVGLICLSCIIAALHFTCDGQTNETKHLILN